MNNSPYTLPKIYEIAFSFRDYSLAIDFLIEASKLQGLTQINSMVELGCGPGQYCREFARRKVKSCGVDLAPEMIEYLSQKGNNETDHVTGVVADRTSFKLEQPVDLAVCMMSTFEHLLTNKDVLLHFDSVAENLVEDGLYIVELSHPRDFLTPESSTKDCWTIEKNGISVTTGWGDGSHNIDPLTEVHTVNVKYEVKSGDAVEIFESTTQTRSYSAGLIRALLEHSGRFRIAAMYGDIDIKQPFDNSKKSWRMILVLRKFG